MCHLGWGHPGLTLSFYPQSKFMTSLLWPKTERSACISHIVTAPPPPLVSDWDCSHLFSQLATNPCTPRLRLSGNLPYIYPWQSICFLNGSCRIELPNQHPFVLSFFEKVSKDSFYNCACVHVSSQDMSACS